MGPQRKFAGLDGLRGVAAVVVVAGHVTGKPQHYYLAVDFFFCLSGFVLAHAYGERLHKGMTVGQFMTARLRRLYPVYLLSLLIALPLALWGATNGTVSWTQFTVGFATALLFLPSPVSPVPFPLNEPAWSLFYELAANSVFAVAFRYCTLIAGVGAALVIGCALYTGGIINSSPWETFALGIPRVAYSFFAGAALYGLRDRHRGIFTIPLPLSVVALIAIMLVPFGSAFDVLSILVLFPALIWLTANEQPPGLSERLCAWAGWSSYSVYILHDPILGFVFHALRHL